MAALGYMVKRVRLVNIKSHSDTTVEFSTGINLIEGDVGSGKTTILQSIEAALFGYEIKNMLRVGESSGEVVVEFEPPLKVGWRITRQGVRGGYLVLDGVRHDLAASEIRSFFVKKFGLGDSPSIRSEPTLFRLAVYVRQEELKSILKGGGEVDELVRRATGVRLYSTARENAASILRPMLRGYVERLDERIGVLQVRVEQTAGVEEELGGVRAKLNEVAGRLGGVEEEYRGASERLDSLREKSGELEREAARLEGEMNQAKQNINSIRLQLDKLTEQILADEQRVLELGGAGATAEELAGLDGGSVEQRIKELDDLVLRLSSDKKEFERNLREIEKHRERVAELQRRLGEELDYEALVEEARVVEGEIKRLYEEVVKTDNTLREYRVIAQTGVCPLCGSHISPEEYEAHLGELEGRLEALRGELELAEKRRGELVGLMERAKVQVELKKEMEEHEEEIKALTERLVYMDYDEEIARVKEERERLRRVQQLLEVNERLKVSRRQHEELSGRLEELQGRVKEIEGELGALRAQIAELKPQLEAAKRRVEELDRLRRELYSEKSALEGKARSLEEVLEQRRRDLAELEEAKKRRGLFEALLNYVSNSLIPVLEQVEAERLRWARRELSTRTREYFALLMQDDDRTVVLGEGYSPTLQRRIGGEWVDIPSPSGGERSAMALSFRLALSEVARLRQGVQADFIMLDEPTDGFSEEQLAKFQSLLERLEIPQIILVTHHRSFESLGSNIILVEYSENGSVVRRVTQ